MRGGSGYRRRERIWEEEGVEMGDISVVFIDMDMVYFGNKNNEYFVETANKLFFFHVYIMRPRPQYHFIYIGAK